MNYMKSIERIKNLDKALSILEKKKNWKFIERSTISNLNRLDNLLIQSSMPVGMNFNKKFWRFKKLKTLGMPRKFRNIISEMLAWEADILPEDEKSYYFNKFID